MQVLCPPPSLFILRSIKYGSEMVLLTVTPAARVAIERYRALKSTEDEDDIRKRTSALEIGSPIEHEDLIQISSYLRRYDRNANLSTHEWRLDTILKGASVYQPPPPAKPEPVRVF